MSSDSDTDQNRRTVGSSPDTDDAEPLPLALDVRTTTYQAENPRWLWTLFCDGPAAGEDRFGDRLTALVAKDVVEFYGDELDDDQRRLATAIMEGRDVL